MMPRAKSIRLGRPAGVSGAVLSLRAMAVMGLYALQNGFMGFERSGLFYGEFSSDRVRIPIACWLVRTSEAIWGTAAETWKILSRKR